MDLVKFVMCALVSMVHMTFYILTKGYIVFGNQGTHDKLNQIELICSQKNVQAYHNILYTLKWCIIELSVDVKQNHKGPESPPPSWM